MPTVNEELRDRFLSHQIGIRRLTTAELGSILRLLDAGELELRRELTAKLRRLSVTRGGVESTIGTRRLEAMLEDLMQLRRDYMAAIYDVLAADLEKLAAYEQGFAVGVVRRALPAAVALDTVLASDDLIRSIVRSRPFQGRLLRNHFRHLIAKNAAVALQMRAVIKEGLLTGQPLLGIVRKVNATALGLERRAVTAIVHTAVHHVTGNMRDEVARLNSDLVEAQQWLATLDLRTTILCAARDGHTYDAVTHAPLDGGPPWLEGPGRLHWNCRSDSTYVLPSWKDMGVNANELTGSQRASMDGHVPAEMNYEQWLATKSDAEIDRVFGKRKGQAWRDGELTARDMLDKRGRQPLTLDQLQLDEG